MKCTPLLIWLVLNGLCLSVPYQSLRAQANPTALPVCGTSDLTPEQARSIREQGLLALQRKRASGAAATPITYVPIRPHIVRRSDGSEGFNLTSLNQVIARTNSYYLLNGLGIQFYFAGTTPDYIDNDELNAVFPYPEGAVVDGRDATDALNQYYVSRFSNSGVGGFARFPTDDIVTTRTFISTAFPESIGDLGNRLIPHELGHTFSLPHTFGFSNGGFPTDELVTRGAGANCTTAGDEICDTPADPYNIDGAFVTNVNGCPQYNPGNTARDANGEAYSPSMTNIMSYYFPCTHDFTPGQYERMQAGLALRQTHTTYTLNAPPSTVAAPGNLSARLNGAVVTLTWQDNADSEMGYFVERSTTSAMAGFIPIGGVGPNETTFVDSDTRLRMHYYYRIRPSNTTTGSLSSIADVETPRTTGPVTGLTTSTITANSAHLSWNSLGDNVTYDVQWRAVGTTAWNTQSLTPQTSFDLNLLTGYTAYEWRVKASDNDTYSETLTFSTLCPTPFTYSYNANPARVSATLNWSSPTLNSNLQWRVLGASDWKTESNVTLTSSYTLTDLTPATHYEWRVQGVCSTTELSEFTSPLEFTTYSCMVPQYASSTSNAESAALSWYMSYSEPGRTHTMRYRPVGTTAWTTVSSLTTSAYSLTGLTNNTIYEWQVKSVCSVTDESDYSPLINFTTRCSSVPIGQLSTPMATAANLAWLYSNAVDPSSMYELQYRPVGSSVWSLLTGTARNGYSYRLVSGLETNTTYEWRMRTACSATAQSEYTPVFTFTTGCYAPTPNNLSTEFISSSAAQLRWYWLADPGTHYDLRYRAAGTTTWATITNLSSTTAGGSHMISGLTNGTTYEWEIRTICSGTEQSGFSPGPSFTTQCKSPDYLISTPLVTSVSLLWGQAGPDVTYKVYYRLSGTPDWTVISDIASTSIAITALSVNTTYDWQVSTQCANGINAAPSGISTFKTFPCNAPYVYTLYTNNRQATSVRLNWSFANADVNTRYEGRYRVVGTSNWVTLPNLSSDRGVGYFDLAGLAVDTQYEWQIKTVCSATESSDFTSSVQFKTLAPCTSMYTTSAGLWSNPDVWSCGRIPLFSDPVLIKHFITIPVNYQAQVKQISYEAGMNVRFNAGSGLKFGQ